MAKKVISSLVILLLVFSGGVFAEKWQEVRSTQGNIGYKVFFDSDYVKERDLGNQLVVAAIRVKMVEEKSGNSSISVNEYKTSPVKADSQGIFYQPKPLEVRVVEVYVYDQNGKEQNRMVDYNRPWEAMKDVHEIPFKIWYMVVAFGMGGTKDTVKMMEKP